MVAALAIAVWVVAQGPRTSSVAVISDNGSDTLTVDDLYEGKMTIPKFDAPKSDYKPDLFVEQNKVITYENEVSTIGINVNQKRGDIDWAAVKESGVDFAMIRVGYRGKERGQILLDAKFQQNIEGALAAGLQVGVYFNSQAITEAEATEEAVFVLEQIKLQQVTYPVDIYWQYATDDNGEPDISARTTGLNGEQATGVIEAFCKKITASGRHAGYYADKKMGYESLNLSRLKDYDMWYAEYQKVPSFYYDFQMWQYSNEAEVPGVADKVPISIAMVQYQK